jgi:hypothetical protein
MFLLRNIAASASIRAFSSAVWRGPAMAGAQFHCLLTAQLRADQISWSPQSRNSNCLIVDGLRAGLLLQAIGLIPLHDFRRNLHHQKTAEQLAYMPEGVLCERRRPVFGAVVREKFIGCELDRFPPLLAGFFFNDLAVAVL